jgi:hypothetical protein
MRRPPPEAASAFAHIVTILPLPPHQPPLLFYFTHPRLSSFRAERSCRLLASAAAPSLPIWFRLRRGGGSVRRGLNAGRWTWGPTRRGRRGAKNGLGRWMSYSHQSQSLAHSSVVTAIRVSHRHLRASWPKKKGSEGRIWADSDRIELKTLSRRRESKRGDCGEGGALRWALKRLGQAERNEKKLLPAGPNRPTQMDRRTLRQTGRDT